MAYSGVLTLVFEGFPPAAMELKNRYTKNGEGPENPGSLFCKCTLAAMAPAAYLTFPEYCALEELFEEFERKRRPTLCCIDRLSVVCFASRDLNSLYHKEDILMDLPLDARGPDEDQLAITQTIIDECVVNKYDYWERHLKSPVRSVEHYTCEDAGPEWTLVAYLAGTCPAVDEIVLDLQREMAQKLPPGLVHKLCWLPAESRHVTLRALPSRKGLPPPS